MTHDDIIRKVADAHGLTFDQVDDLVAYVWHLVIRCMNDPRMPTVMLQNLGKFVVSPIKLRRLMNTMDKRGSKYRNHPNFDTYRENVTKIYWRRLEEEFGNMPNRYAHPIIAQDVKKLRDAGGI